jgi:hypothetical protein
VRSITQINRIYGDFLRAVYETYGARPFTLLDLAEKGIEFPEGKSPSFFRNRGVFAIRRRGRPYQWRLTESAISLLGDDCG